MKIRVTHLWQVTKQAAGGVIFALTGLAALVMVFLPSRAAQAQTLPGPSVPAGPDKLAMQLSFRHILAATRQQSDAALLTYQVKAGQSMSSIADEQCHGQARDWTGIYAASRAAHLTGKNANMFLPISWPKESKFTMICSVAKMPIHSSMSMRPPSASE